MSAAVLLWFGAGVGLAATVTDVRSREIPNWLSLAALVGGLAGNLALSGWAGLGSGLLGALVGFGVFYVRYRFFGMGGGDVKLMAGFGAILGVEKAVLGILLSAALGGILALGFLLVRRVRQAPGDGTIPYAPAISLGCCLALVDRL